MHSTPARRLAVAAISLGILAGCGGDDGAGGDASDDTSGGGGGAELSADQQAVVDEMMSSAETQSFDVDRACVEQVAAKLSDADAALLAADPTAEVSEAADDLSSELFGCIDSDDLADGYVQELEAAGTVFDEQCVRDAVAGFDPTAVTDASAPAPRVELATLIYECVELGS